MSFRFLVFKTTIIFSLFAFVACDNTNTSFDENLGIDAGEIRQALGRDRETMKVLDMEFAPDYKTFSISVDVFKDVGPYELADSVHNRFEVKEKLEGLGNALFSAPRLVEIQNVEAERVRDENLKMLVLIDRTLPQSDLTVVASQVKDMRTTFKYDNLFVAFMTGDSVSATMKATDYVIDKYCTSTSDNHSLIYRSMLDKCDEMSRHDGVWANSGKIVLLTFSNGKVYRENTDEPLDRDHFLLQEELTGTNAAVADTNIYAFYSNCSHDSEAFDDYAANILRIFCTNSGGEYIDDFSWTPFKHKMYDDMNYVFPDNVFVFENPQFKVYRGEMKKLILNFYNRETDTLIASMSAPIMLGEVFAPIIVSGNSIEYVIIQGIVLGAFLVFLLYLIFQFIVPAVKYWFFSRKYVVRYKNGDMSFGNKVVEKACYLCKAPFQPGDKIVVKCEHTMHKNCWDENDYHCPEYSSRCKHGSHYFNSDNLFDKRNAPFYYKWIRVALIGSVLAWLCFIIYVNMDLLQRYYGSVHSSVTQPPVVGLLLGFFLTIGFSRLAIRPGLNIRVAGTILLRALLAAVGSYLFFVQVNLVIYYFKITRFTFLFNWIPWTASGFLIAYCSVFSRQVFHKKWVLLATLLIGIVSMYAWNFLFCYTELDFRVLILLSFMIYAVGIAACITTVAPRSEHYFLKVQGAVKTMDIALYKWFRNTPDRVVSIGRSVDCSLQLSWDIMSDVAPVQAEIRMRKRIPYLVPLEPGVYIGGRRARVNKRYRLFHGRTFTIGQTIFTYIEKDR